MQKPDSNETVYEFIKHFMTFRLIFVSHYKYYYEFNILAMKWNCLVFKIKAAVQCLYITKINIMSYNQIIFPFQMFI